MDMKNLSGLLEKAFPPGKWEFVQEGIWQKLVELFPYHRNFLEDFKTDEWRHQKVHNLSKLIIENGESKDIMDLMVLIKLATEWEINEKRVYVKHFSYRIPDLEKRANILSEHYLSYTPASVTCYFLASMDGEVLVNRTTAITLILSQELIEKIDDALNATASSSVDPSKTLSIQCRPVKDFSIIGSDTQQEKVPLAGQPKTIAFTGKCTQEGTCELAIDIWQGQLPLCTLTLQPVCVQNITNKDPLSANANASLGQPLEKPIHKLTIMERTEGLNTYYDFTLDSPELGILEVFESTKIIGSRDEYVTNLYSEIEQLWQTANYDPARFRQILRQMGVKLFNTLIPDRLKQILWNNREKFKSIIVFSIEPFIPWELVLIKDPAPTAAATAADTDKFFCEMGLTRWLMKWQPPVSLVIRKDKVRYVIPQYLDPNRQLAASSLEQEYLEQTWKATAVIPDQANVQQLLQENGGFDILHFSCHAEVSTNNIMNGKLILQDQRIGNDYPAGYLTQLDIDQIQPYANPRPIIFLNACQSGRLGKKLAGMGGFAESFLCQAGAGVFVGTLWSVEDKASLTFMRTWYDDLAAGRTLAEATVHARQVAASEEGATYLSYVIYGHPNFKLVQKSRYYLH